MWATVAGVVALLSLLSGAAAVAHGAMTSCTYDDGVVRLRLASQHSVRLFVRDRQIRYADLADGSRYGPCGSARVRNTSRVVVTETVPGTSRLIFSQQDERFGPGRTMERVGISEIEVRLGTLTNLWVRGRPRGERVTLGSRGVNLNRDRDVDLIGTNLKQIHIWTFGGNDRFSPRGGHGTGDPWRAGGVVVSGGDGDDVIIGTRRADLLDGGLGFDRIYGRGGRDDINGGDWSDDLFGGRGRDAIYGGSGSDRIAGGPGDDALFSYDSSKDTVDGGKGSDKAFIDELDTTTRVESTKHGHP